MHSLSEIKKYPGSKENFIHKKSFERKTTKI